MLKRKFQKTFIFLSLLNLLFSPFLGTQSTTHRNTTAKYCGGAVQFASFLGTITVPLRIRIPQRFWGSQDRGTGKMTVSDEVLTSDKKGKVCTQQASIAIGIKGSSEFLINLCLIHVWHCPKSTFFRYQKALIVLLNVSTYCENVCPHVIGFISLSFRFKSYRPFSSQ